MKARRLVVLLLWVVGGVALTSGALWGAWAFFDGIGPAEESTYDTIRTAITAVGVITIGGGAAIALRRQATLETQADLDAEKEARSKVADLHARYQQVATQLGHDKPMIRIAGVYALEALADEWTRQGDIEQRDVCIDLLCGYLRSPATHTPQSTPEAPVLDPTEAEVRATITTVIARHLQDPKSPTSWSNHNYNFTGATLANTNFDGATFNGTAVFDGATFTADAGFSGATFNGTARFGRATFNGTAWFIGATFTADAWFIAATFTGDAWFIAATFTGTARFGGVTFTSTAVFSGVTFTADAGFDGVTFTVGAGFDGVTFTGDAWFGGAKFTGDAGFDEATFTSTARFGGAKFTSTARFDEATFTADARFGGATFNGTAEFRGATFAEGVPTEVERFMSS